MRFEKWRYRYIRGLMFRCVDTTRYICKFLGARDIFALVVVCREVHEFITPLLVGACINKYEMKGMNLISITKIPLLDIEEFIDMNVRIARHIILGGAVSFPIY